MTDPVNVLGALVAALRATAQAHGALQVAPASVLWCDSERRWEGAIPCLRALLPSLLTLGQYSPRDRQGPAIWVKCALVEATAETPVVYLPGVSRSDLRAIEICPRALQPLAELQYRGVFWSQANAKDWTVNAFLTSKAGGLGLDVAQDKATQDALLRAIVAGVLWDVSVEDLRQRQITAVWLDSLLAPDPVRDALAWMNDPVGSQSLWAGPRWVVFAARCRNDLGFDPVADGIVTASERLAARSGRWAPIWAHYADSFEAFPNIVHALAGVFPPGTRDLFYDVSGYPRVNDDQEAALRHQLNLSASASSSSARALVLIAEKEHGARRGWLWARMRLTPLAKALEHLAKLAAAPDQPPAGSTPDEMAENYRAGAWQIDAWALKALAEVESRQDIDAVSAALRAIYLPWLEDTARRFQDVVQGQGGLSKAIPAKVPPVAGECVVFVDGLRYDVGMDLVERLRALGSVEFGAHWTCIPSVTASGKPWCSPVAWAIAGSTGSTNFEPSVASDGKSLSTHHFRRLLGEQGYQVMDRTETGDPSGAAWVEYGDLDHYGHTHELRLARDLSHQLNQVVERIGELRDAGWGRFRIVTDHGWLLVPGGLPKAELQKHEFETRWGRCAVLKNTSHAAPLTFGWDWCKQVQIAMAPGIASFKSGAIYAHGGLTLQESLVPMIRLSTARAETARNVQIKSAVWRGLRCHVELEEHTPNLRLDIRTKAGLAESSVIATARSFESGKAAVAVSDDTLIGTAALVVILDESGAVIQKRATTIGEQD
jgi:hypothetical protein